MPLRIAVINNGYLGMVRQWQELFYGKRYAATPMAGPDFCKLAEAYGLAAFRVEDRAGVAPALREARRTPGPALIEFQRRGRGPASTRWCRPVRACRRCCAVRCRGQGR